MARTLRLINFGAPPRTLLLSLVPATLSFRRTVADGTTLIGRDMFPDRTPKKSWRITTQGARQEGLEARGGAGEDEDELCESVGGRAIWFRRGAWFTDSVLSRRDGPHRSNRYLTGQRLSPSIHRTKVLPVDCQPPIDTSQLVSLKEGQALSRQWYPPVRAGHEYKGTRTVLFRQYHTHTSSSRTASNSPTQPQHRLSDQARFSLTFSRCSLHAARWEGIGPRGQKRFGWRKSMEGTILKDGAGAPVVMTSDRVREHASNSEDDFANIASNQKAIFANIALI
ncbi:hypothetical protein FPV67DRAFT_1654995 [Lyophyllum atratum]|nr:hypothetical protein FPV67DRAFT_1654995 [Lyophyllum atratum]